MSAEEILTGAQADEMIEKLDCEDLLSHAMTLLGHYRSELAVTRLRLAELEAHASATGRTSQDLEWRKLLERALPAPQFGQQVVHYERTRLLLRSLSFEQFRGIFAMLSAEQASAFEDVYEGYAQHERENVPS